MKDKDKSKDFLASLKKGLLGKFTLTSETELETNVKKFKNIAKRVDACLREGQTIEDDGHRQDGITLKEEDLLRYLDELGTENSKIFKKTRSPNKIKYIARKVWAKHQTEPNPHLKVVHAPKDGKIRDREPDGYEFKRD